MKEVQYASFERVFILTFGKAFILKWIKYFVSHMLNFLFYILFLQMSG